MSALAGSPVSVTGTALPLMSNVCGLAAVVVPIALRPLAANPVARFLYHWRWPLVVLWFTAVALAILARFWDYWSTLI